jgi:hypothetical protein
MYSRQGNKRAVESFVVAKTGQAFYNTAGSGNNLTNPSTGAVRLADGQIGIFSVSPFGSVAMNVATDTTPTLAEAPVIAFFQGTDGSANPSIQQYPYPLYNRPYAKSHDVNGNNSVLVTKQTYQHPTTAVWVLGAPAGELGEIGEPQDGTEYTIKIGYKGRRFDEMFNENGTLTYSPSYVTPNYTALNTAEPLDHLLQNLTWQINRNSKVLNLSNRHTRGNEHVIALAIDSTGTAGTPIGGATPLAAGDVLPVVNTNFGVRSIILTEDQANSIKAAALAVAGGDIADLTWSVLTIDLVTAGLTTGGVADMVMLVALDADLAFEDKIPFIKTNMVVTLNQGFEFPRVSLVQGSFPFEGSGTARQWNLKWRATEMQRLYSLDHTMSPIIEFPSPIDLNQRYVSYHVYSQDVNDIDTFNTSISPLGTYILVPATETTLITAIDTALNSWLPTTGNSIIREL